MRGLFIALLLASAPLLAGSRQDPILLRKGLPKAAGLSKLVVVSNYKGLDPRFKAIKKLAAARRAKILKFKDDKIESVRKALARIGPEFVAVAVTPETVDINFHYRVLELSRDLDSDPMPDFSFGYLCARDGADLEKLVGGILRRELLGDRTVPVAKVVALTSPGSHIEGLDYLMHFGHGQAWRVDNGMTGIQLGKLDLRRAPVVWSGACFNGVFSRSHHKSSRQLVFLAPTTIDPARLMTLNWVKAGASGYFAAIDGDRGEMAMAEWEYFREHACSLGETITYQYRLAFTSVYADFTKFPRFTPGYRKKMSFYNVMLRGMVSRMLLSDPGYRPLARPLDKPVNVATVERNAGGLVVTVTLKRWSAGQHVNYLPQSKKGIFDARIYLRVPLDGDPPATEATVVARNGPELVELTRHHVRHEVWGGKRYLNLQAEAPMGRFKAGTQVTYTFARGKR